MMIMITDLDDIDDMDDVDNVADVDDVADVDVSWCFMKNLVDYDGPCFSLCSNSQRNPKHLDHQLVRLTKGSPMLWSDILGWDVHPPSKIIISIPPWNLAQLHCSPRRIPLEKPVNWWKGSVQSNRSDHFQSPQKRIESPVPCGQPPPLEFHMRPHGLAVDMRNWTPFAKHSALVQPHPGKKKNV